MNKKFYSGIHIHDLVRVLLKEQRLPAENKILTRLRSIAFLKKGFYFRRSINFP
ncbi:MAG: hypothetical protein M3Z92_02240 [Bacteroidota bacterium]|nr:hypothetical protein [Bacteroidota bacterium]